MALQVPPPMAINETGGSLLVKLATAEPVLIRSPQSSIICAITATGQPAGAENPVPTEVSTGRSLVGTHAAVAKSRRYAGRIADDIGGEAETTRSNVTVCVVESLNASVTVPG